MNFKEFEKVCGNLHIQSNINIIKFDKSLYMGEYWRMPLIIRKHYYIKQFYVSTVANPRITIYVSLKQDTSNKLYTRLKKKLSITLARICNS